MRDGSLLPRGRRSTDTIEHLRKVEKDLAQSDSDNVVLRMCWREESAKSANLASRLREAEKTIEALLDPKKLQLFYELTRGAPQCGACSEIVLGTALAAA